MESLEEHFARQGKKKRRNLGDSMWPCYLGIIALYLFLALIEQLSLLCSR